jgi:glycolate oxidase FAD binding subunit
LFAGSYGTLGAIVEVAVRLHPLRPTASAGGDGDDPDLIAKAASELAHSRLEAQSLDIAWRGGRGGVLARFAGAEAEPQAEAARRLLADQGLDATLLQDDDAAWEAQRQAQRGDLVVRVSAVQTQLADVLRAAERHDGGVVGRAALGIAWVSLPASAGAEAVTDLRATLAPATCVVLDAPDEVRTQVDPWGVDPWSNAVALMRATKQRFDPAGILAPGLLL